MVSKNEIINSEGNFQAVTCGKKYRAYYEKENDTIFVYQPYSKRYGYRYSIDEFIRHFDSISIRDKAKEWKKRLKKAIDVMNISGLWTEIKEIFENLYYYVTYDDKVFLQNNYYFNSDINQMDLIARYKSKYPFMVMRNSNEEALDTDYFWGVSDCIIKPMYFGVQNKSEKENIKHALNEKKKYSTRARTSYDVSFEYNPEANRAWYSEEFKNCGNGHYYLALNYNLALFCEND